MKKINFIAIDFETANSKLSSICEAGICVVKEGQVMETKSWYVRPDNNHYNYWNIRIHGIKPVDTENAPAFPAVWEKIKAYLEECPILVAHNANFDMNCIRKTMELYDMEKPFIQYYCTCRTARRYYNFGSNTLSNLCEQLHIPEGTHHRAGDDAEMCARLLLRELQDINIHELQLLNNCGGIL